MTDESTAKLHTLLAAYAERTAKSPAARGYDEGERQRRACGDILRSVVAPVLDAVMVELRNAGHDASTRDHTERENAYPSVALSFTPRPAGGSPDVVLASAIIFRYDQRHGIVVQREVKPSPTKRRVGGSGGGERLGTMGIDAVTPEWVESKTLDFIEAVLKAN